MERESEKREASPGKWLESFADEPNKANVGPDCLRRVRLVNWVEHPAVPCKRRNVGRRDAAGMCPGSSGIVVGRTSGEATHEGAVRVMAKAAGGRPLLVTRGTACGGKVMAPARKTPKTKVRGRQVEGVHRVLPDREEVVR